MKEGKENRSHIIIIICSLDQRQLQKEVINKKQEAQALMAEMESITQAFEEMQEQNIRLLQQLKVSNVR